jgi:hypothetical protein
MGSRQQRAHRRLAWVALDLREPLQPPRHAANTPPVTTGKPSERPARQVTRPGNVSEPAAQRHVAAPMPTRL